MFACLDVNMGFIMTSKQQYDASFYVSILIAFVTGVLSFLKPNIMWNTCKYYEMLFESQLIKFRCKVGDYDQKIEVSNVVSKYKENLFEMEKEMIAQKPLNKIYRINMKKQLFHIENKNESCCHRMFKRDNDY